ncbi:LysR substrate-binding domain-containing protein [Vibrio proteolyticus]|uniref:Xap operon transcriptional regulator n=1 Tax=Vibrio proteolyticus NBRC 13287 TaxID=1219065 RepID=U3A3T9_VIBPR|nr:LysR substrate-binding domain-containing protein [Vibrio proteolyticus]GAD68345.1 xap operon transcriptional regulator [Vibrio proteolyticus NBRC 13287]
MSSLSNRISMKMLRYFLKVAETGHFSRAAEQLNITKSPLSTQIKELETLLGSDLFERDSRNVRLTPAGAQLRNECVSLFDQLDRSLNKVQQVARQDIQSIHLGLMSSIFWAGFGEALGQLSRQHPHIRINLLESAPSQQLTALRDHRIDMGLVRYADAQRSPHLQCVTLLEENMVVALPAHHPLSGKTQLSLKELTQESFVMLSQHNSASTDLIIRHCEQLGFTPDVVQQVIEPNTVVAVVATSELLSVVPASYQGLSWSNVRFVALKEQIRADICAVTLAQPSADLTLIAEELKRSLEQL